MEKATPLWSLLDVRRLPDPPQIRSGQSAPLQRIKSAISMQDRSWCVHYQLSLEITNNGVPHNDQAMARQMSIGCIMESPSLPREDNQGSVCPSVCCVRCRRIVVRIRVHSASIVSLLARKIDKICFGVEY